MDGRLHAQRQQHFAGSSDSCLRAWAVSFLEAPDFCLLIQFSHLRPALLFVCAAFAVHVHVNSRPNAFATQQSLQKIVDRPARAFSGRAAANMLLLEWTGLVELVGRCWSNRASRVRLFNTSPFFLVQSTVGRSVLVEPSIVVARSLVVEQSIGRSVLLEPSAAMKS